MAWCKALVRGCILPLAGLTTAALPLSAAFALTTDDTLIPRRALFGNPARTSATISPDGHSIAFLAPVDGVLNIWVAPVDRLAAARAVTSERVRPIQRFRWAPDSAHLLVLRDGGGNEAFRLSSVATATGIVREYKLFDGAPVEIVKISPTVRDAILISTVRGDAQSPDIWRLNLVTGTASQVWRNPGGYHEIMADSRLRPIAAQFSRPDGGGRIDAIRADGSTKPVLSWGQEDALTGLLAVSDNHSAYVVTAIGRDTSVLVEINLRTGRKRVIGDSDRGDVGAIVQDPVGGQVLAYSIDYFKRSWHSLDRRTARDIAVLNRSVQGQWVVDSQSADGQLWTVYVDADGKPPSFQLYDRRRRRLEQLFEPRPALTGRQLAKMQALELTARDGIKLVSYLTLPVGSDSDGNGVPDRPLPLVLRVHGGPWSRDSFGYNSAHMWLADRGYAVLSVNFRGSTGFGKRFFNAGNLEWGRGMQYDLYDAVDEMVRRKVALPERVAIMGSSYGGYAVLVALAMDPNRFRCGIEIAGPSNLLTLSQSLSAPALASIRAQFTTRMGDPGSAAGRAMLIERSPLTYGAAIRAPLLIGHGANDPRVPQAEAEQIVAAIKRRGTEVSYVLYPDEGHGLARAPNRESFNALSEQMLGRCLGGRVEPIGDALKGSSIEIRERGGLVLP